jgi:outer membrane protein assembly factor BamB
MPLNAISEVRRLPAPAQRPQAIAFDGTLLWLGSLVERKLYALDPQRWTVERTFDVPGLPYGLGPVDGELLLLLSVGDEDHRIIYHVDPNTGVRATGTLTCPGDTGSHLSSDGERLYVSQWYNKTIVAVDRAGKEVETIALPHEICGHTRVDGRFYCVTTDDETSGRYYLTRVEPGGRSEDLAAINFDARGLAFDGTNFWTNHREAHQTVAFVIPSVSEGPR